ncbi:MAG: hypothetical protein H0T48_07350 [Gemmatimonadaceae bacterium]|nr:hypothetical protein [Gemmatimonadaceae bacterium]
MTDTTTTIENEALAAESYRVAGQAVFAAMQGYGIGTIGPLGEGAGLWIDPNYRYPGAGETVASIKAAVRKAGRRGKMTPAREKRYIDSIFVVMAGRAAEQLHRPGAEVSAASVRDLELAMEMTYALRGEQSLVTDAVKTVAVLQSPAALSIVQRVARRLADGEAITGTQILAGGMAE